MGSRQEAGEQGAGSKGEEFSPQQEQHPAPLPLFNAQCPMPNFPLLTRGYYVYCHINAQP
ncbi:hypothetical protein COO91_07631 [Nostoc flagelliforme CCNUN1]|uniref:Uncharacterized protein n=1 Tax=Nostoc flagelliforme CCNUN1 TaxID=2038116 RepID=A0A2K8T1T9_9NOSO|nr:hypothetical protein COO91_07631 [Nostoc flagelliforme CCNUN1]